MAVAHMALAWAELHAPVSAQGTFIAAGQALDAFAAVGKVFATATRDLFIIAPYADANLLTGYAVLALEGVPVRVFADKATVRPGLKPAFEAWSKQHGAKRPLQVRLAAPRQLLDRLILVDGTVAYTVGQSFNALAERAHTSIVRADPGTAVSKVAAYEDMWQAATPL